MSEWSDFEKYVITKLDTLEDKVSDIDKKVSGIRSKVAMVSTFITALLTGVAHYISKKLDL